MSLFTATENRMSSTNPIRLRGKKAFANAHLTDLLRTHAQATTALSACCGSIPSDSRYCRIGLRVAWLRLPIIRLIPFILAVWLAAGVSIRCQAQSSETFTVNSTVNQLTDKMYKTMPDLTKPPGNQGALTRKQLTDLINAVNEAVPPQPIAGSAKARTTILHLLKWGNADHTQVSFQKWYLVDSSVGKSSIYFETEEASLQRTTISGQTHFRIIYVHLDADATATSESFVTSAPAGVAITKLKEPITYTINVTKQSTQLVQDIQTLAQILGKGTGAAGSTPELGYYTAFDFNSMFKTSSIKISAALPNATANKSPADPVSAANSRGSSTNGGTAANALATQSYTNERPAYLSLGVAVPLNSYKDLTYSQTGSMLTPSTVNRQNIYVTANFYYPPAEPGMMAVRWLPHPFFGLPIKGQPLRNMALGVGLGLKWAEPFAALVFDEQSRVNSGATTAENRWVRKGIFGLNISISALKTALSASGSSTSKSSSK